MTNWEYCTIEWVWMQNTLQLNMPDGEVTKAEGSYAELVDLLNQLGQQGWEVATCAGAGNYLFWTLKRAM